MSKLLGFACLILLSVLPVLAQRGGRSGSASAPRIANPDPSPSSTIFLSGKVVLDDGSVLTESATIQTICRGQKNSVTHTDSRGNFSFQFGDRSAASGGVEFDTDTSTRTSSIGRPERRNLQECELQASLAGFTSDAVQLGGRFSGEESADVGRIVLHRMANVEGFTISATTAEAPGDARKALESGRQQTQKGKWDDAQKSFERAVALFPRFAVAWFELGQVQLHKDERAAARYSFQQSIVADAKYINPYHSLTQVAMHDRNWHELTEFSEKLLALNPVNFPDIWLSDSVGHYCLQNWAAAEKSARRGLEVDTDHHVPKLEYMLGLVLLQKPDYPEAIQHMQAFLSHATKPADIAEAQKQLEQMARLSASVNRSVSEAK
jgi:tetratricopeptide (TPR) repeat protein